MDDHTRSATARAIETMRENLGQDLTVDDMARAARLSKFHFARVFRRATGISPRRFLAAMRLQRAKRLLISTSMTVAEICNEVGYSGVGTFSSRFSSSVGVSPRTYRELGGAAPPAAGDRHADASIHGEVVVPNASETGLVFVGLFPDSAPQGQPANGTVLPGAGPYRLQPTCPGPWFVFAHSAYPQEHASVGSHGPITVRPDAPVRADLKLTELGPVDDPSTLLNVLDGWALALVVAS